MKVFSYVMTVDDGGAPNLDAPFTTLAVCKPRIRFSALPGDLVIGFSGQTLSAEPHAVRWAGIVRERLPFADYWNDPRFQSKKPGFAEMPDNIYRQLGSEMVQVPNLKHRPDESSKDLSGRLVLAFDPSWYFGPSNPMLPAKFGLRIVGGRRGHRVTEISPQCWTELTRWLDDQRPTIGTMVARPGRDGNRKSKC